MKYVREGYSYTWTQEHWDSVETLFPSSRWYGMTANPEEMLIFSSKELAIEERNRYKPEAKIIKVTITVDIVKD